jgi:signal transduction histidine kinase
MSSRAPLKRRPQLVLEEPALPVVPGSAQRDFVRLVSHELRTPLNSIIGFSEILSRELFGPLGAPQYKDYADIIMTSGQRMLRLVNQVVEIAKLQSGAEDLDLVAEPLDAVFEDVAKTIAPDLVRRRLTLRCALPDPAPTALVDARAIRTAIVNLLQNAATFAPEGGEIRLTGRLRGPLVQIDVADDGEGLDPAQVARLMRPFEQAEHTLVRKTDGAGLGWAIVRALSEAMGGRFEIATAPNQGLTATLSFRRAR